MKTRDQILSYNYGPRLFDAKDMANVLNTVTRVVDQADKYRGESHGAHWVSEVVGRLIQLLPTLSMESVEYKRTMEALEM